MSETRLILLCDIIVAPNADSIVESIGIIGSSTYDEVPEECASCGSEEVEELEVLGASDIPLLWECQMCDSKYLMYDKAKTELLLTPALGLWTNPNAWGWKDKAEFN